MGSNRGDEGCLGCNQQLCSNVLSSITTANCRERQPRLELSQAYVYIVYIAVKPNSQLDGTQTAIILSKFNSSPALWAWLVDRLTEFCKQWRRCWHVSPIEY